MRDLVNVEGIPFAVLNQGITWDWQSWGRVFADKSDAAQRAVYADSAFRNAFREELKTATGFTGDWRRITVHEVKRQELKPYEGRTVFAAPSPILPISAIRPPMTATSARRPGAPVPSTTVPPLISRS